MLENETMCLSSWGLILNGVQDFIQRVELIFPKGSSQPSVRNCVLARNYWWSHLRIRRSDVLHAVIPHLLNDITQLYPLEYPFIPLLGTWNSWTFILQTRGAVLDRTDCNVVQVKHSGGSRGGARGARPSLSLIFRQNWGRKGRKKIFFETAPSLFSQVLDDRPKTSPSPPPPRPLSEGLDPPMKQC